MKKILIAIILFNLMCACLVTNVNAAYAYSCMDGQWRAANYA